MNKTSIKYSIIGFLGTLPLNILLFSSFDILKMLGISNETNRVALFFTVYAVEISIYWIAIHLLQKKESEKNLIELKKDIQEATGKMLP